MHVNDIDLCFCGAIHACTASYGSQSEGQGLPQSLLHKLTALICI